MEENIQLLIQAARCGDVGEVQRLIPLSEPKAYNSCALQWAAQNDHAKCVELLIPVSDPKARDSLALQWAVVCGNDQCVDLLFDVSDADVALTHLKRGYLDNDKKLKEFLCLKNNGKYNCQHN